MRSTPLPSLARLALLAAALMVVAAPLWAAENITGLWKIIDDKTNKPTAYVLLYMYQGQMYGRMIATIDKDTGKIDDTIVERKKVAEGFANDTKTCGADFVFEMKDKGKEWKGGIIDPKDGKVYDCAIRPDPDKLFVWGSLRGTGGLLGRKQNWFKASAADLPAGVPLDPKDYKPQIPTGKK